MGADSKIEWCDHTFNPWVGCTKVSPGCLNCYAESWAKRSGLVEWGARKKRRRTSWSNWQKPFKWNEAAAKAGTRATVFCASLADVADPEAEWEWWLDLLLLVDATPALIWLFLSKRPDELCRRLKMENNDRANLWVGTTAEDQRRADERISHLLDTPATIRFLSCEPLIEAVTLDLEGIDWVIVGGESGPKARQMDPDWARSIRDQCHRSNIPFFMKQMTKKAPIPSDLMIREFPDA